MGCCHFAALLIALWLGCSPDTGEVRAADAEDDRADPAGDELSAQVAEEPAHKDAALEHLDEPFTGDLDGMVERGFLRILTAHNPLYFTFDGTEEHGLTVELARLFEQHLAKRLGRARSPTVVLVPVARDELLPRLIAGRGDLAAANLTITSRRAERVAFSEPLHPDISEWVVTGPAAPEIASLDDLVEVGLHLSDPRIFQRSTTRSATNAKSRSDTGPTEARRPEPLASYFLGCTRTGSS